MKHKNYLLLPLAAALLMGAGVASAATIAVSSGTVPVAGGPVTITASFTGDGLVVAYQSDVLYDGTKFSAVATTNAGTGLCSVLSPGVIRLLDGTPDNSPLGNTTTCSIVFTANAGAGGDVEPLTLGGVQELNDAGGNSLPLANHTFTNGSITWLAGPPPDVVVTFNPISGSTVAFGGGLPGANVTQSIAIGNTGTIGTGTVSGCVLSGPDAASFSITGGNPSTVPPATSLGLQATLGAAALNATLTCNVADSSATTSATWTLTAPAGTVLQAPTLASNPASGASITLPNSYGTPVTTPIAFTPTGGDAGGPNASVTCSTASAGFTVTPAGALTFTPPGGAAQNAVVGCTPGASPVSGVVTCTGTHQGGAINWSYDVTCPAAQTAPPPPTFVPATSLWSKLALFGVFAALGMLVLGLRRNH